MFDRVNLFEMELELPDSRLANMAGRLIGFNQRYARIKKDLLLLSDPSAMEQWSKHHYGHVLPICNVFSERYPLIVFQGDVGTGKTAMAEASCDRLAREIGKPAVLFKLSTRVRGSGMVGNMSQLINDAFCIVAEAAGKQKYSFLIIDEADSLISTRAQEHSHHEDKVGVNTLIQKIDEIRKFNGRILVFINTNRIEILDPAVLRRASRIEHFDRPNDRERSEIIHMDCAGLGLSDESIKTLVDLTGTREGTRSIGLTFSDMRLRWLPEAFGSAFPDRKLEFDDLVKAAMVIMPTPPLEKPEINLPAIAE